MNRVIETEEFKRWISKLPDKRVALNVSRRVKRIKMEIAEDMMKKAGLREFDVANYIDTPADARLYLEEVLKDGDAAEFLGALDDIVRSKAMEEIAKVAGISLEEESCNFQAISKTLRALSLAVSVDLADAKEEKNVAVA